MRWKQKNKCIYDLAKKESAIAHALKNQPTTKIDRTIKLLRRERKREIT